jgi:hypothetical protein
VKLLPFFLDRSSLSLFGDVGVAGCPRDPLYATTCAPALRPSAADSVNGVTITGIRFGKPIGSVGAELALAATVLEWDSQQTLRFGVAVPVLNRQTTRARTVSPYVAFGFSF